MTKSASRIVDRPSTSQSIRAGKIDSHAGAAVCARIASSNDVAERGSEHSNSTELSDRISTRDHRGGQNMSAKLEPERKGGQTRKCQTQAIEIPCRRRKRSAQEVQAIPFNTQAIISAPAPSIMQGQ